MNLERTAFEFLIRPWSWESDDIEALTGLLHRAYAGLLEQGLKFVATTQNSEVTRERMLGNSPFVMESDGRIVGTMTLSYPIVFEPEDPPYYGREGVALLSQFGIEPSHQGRGLGSAFIRHSLDWSKFAGAKELVLDTSDQATHLIEMYKHWGFSVVAPHRWPSANYASVVMARSV